MDTGKAGFVGRVGRKATCGPSGTRPAQRLPIAAPDSTRTAFRDASFRESWERVSRTAWSPNRHKLA